MEKNLSFNFNLSCLLDHLPALESLQMKTGNMYICNVHGIWCRFWCTEFLFVKFLQGSCCENVL